MPPIRTTELPDRSEMKMGHLGKSGLEGRVEYSGNSKAER